MQTSISSILQRHNLKDTQSRRLVLKALMHVNKPISQKEIHHWIKSQDATTNLVTVYRTIEKFEEIGVVHRHPSSHGFILCGLQDELGCHSFLSCQACGKVEEFCDKALCQQEGLIAKKFGFKANQHVSEIIGLCATCQ